MRYGRLVVNLVITGACVGLIALEIAGPSNGKTTRRPIDTFSHVDVRVDDHGVHVPVGNVAAGEVEVTLTDARTHTKSPLLVASEPPGLSLHPGTQLTTLRDLTTYQLTAKPMTGSGSLTVVMPRLDATREPGNRVTVNVDTNGMNTPYRDTRLESPVAAGATDALNASVPWTTVVAGPGTVVIRNHQPSTLTCSVDGGAATAIPHGATRTIKATFAPGRNLVDCGTTKLELQT